MDLQENITEKQVFVVPVFFWVDGPLNEPGSERNNWVGKIMSSVCLVPSAISQMEQGGLQPTDDAGLERRKLENFKVTTMMKKKNPTYSSLRRCRWESNYRMIFPK